MASLHSKCVLLQKTGKFLGVSAGDVGDNVIITYQNAIILFDIVEKKAKLSWTMRTGQQLTAPAVYCRVNREFVCVLNSNIIKTFTMEEDFEKGDRYTIQEKIESIVAVAGVEELYVLFSNGSCAQLELLLENPSAESTRPRVAVVSNCKYSIGDGHTLLAHDLTSADEKHTVTTIDLKAEKLVQVSTLSNGEHKLCHSCINTMGKEAVLLSLWSDGSICKAALPQTTEELSLQNLCKLHLDKTTDIVSMESTSAETISLVAKNLNGNTGTHCYTVDMKFGLCKKADIKVTDATKQIHCLGNKLYFAETKQLSCADIETFPLTLSSVMMSKSSSSTTAVAAKLNTHITKWPYDSSAVTQVASEEDNALIDHLLKASGDIKDIDSTWDKLLEGKRKEQQMRIVSSPFMLEFIEKLTTKESSFPEQFLTKVVSSCGYLSPKCGNLLITAAITNNSLQFLHKCLQSVSNITEEDVVRSITYLVKNHLDSEQMETDAAETINTIMNDVINLPHSSDELIKAFRLHLPFENSQTFLSYLTKRLEHCPADKPSTLNSILKWLGIVLDANLAQFIVTNESWKFIKALHAVVIIQVEYYDELRSLEVLLTQLVNKDKLRRQESFLYRVEVMSI